MAEKPKVEMADEINEVGTQKNDNANENEIHRRQASSVLISAIAKVRKIFNWTSVIKIFQNSESFVQTLYYYFYFYNISNVLLIRLTMEQIFLVQKIR